VRHVHLERRGAEARARRGADIDRDGAAVDGDGEVLAACGRSRMWRQRTASGPVPKWKLPR